MEEAYAAYLDARRHLAEVKAGRGYYPVVAMTDNGTQLPVAAQVGNGKGKPAKGKSKGKPPGKRKAGKGGRFAPQQPKGMARAAATKCLRCGQAGHWAAQCPKPPAGQTSQPGSPIKRASSGATTYAGPKEKRQKDAKNLNESILNVSDRIAFTEAKRKELGSFFTNNVWEFSHENEATPGRILKAHFILKWSKHPDGSPCADAGLVDSTSPTLTRLGRTTLMSLASTLAWDTFIADITTAFLQGKEHSAERTLWIRSPTSPRSSRYPSTRQGARTLTARPPTRSAPNCGHSSVLYNGRPLRRPHICRCIRRCWLARGPRPLSPPSLRPTRPFGSPRRTPMFSSSTRRLEVTWKTLSLWPTRMLRSPPDPTSRARADTVSTTSCGQIHSFGGRPSRS